MTASHSHRPALSGVRTQFANTDARVVNLSRAGALVHSAHKQTPGSHGALTLEMDGTPLQLTARVLRCEPLPGPVNNATAKFALTLTFIDPSPEATARLEGIGRTGRPLEEGARHLRVSLVRRCPACQSRDVARESQRSYSCCQCGRVFTGFRLGFLRFSR